jgi:hypothetical protein
VSAWFGDLAPKDWAAIDGTIVAALIGVAGVWASIHVAARSRYRSRIEETLAGVIGALGDRASVLDRWAAQIEVSLGPHGTKYNMRNQVPIGAPIDAALQSTVEVAWLSARKRRDLKGMRALGDAIYKLKFAVAAMQIVECGRIAADIRRWRSGEMSLRAFTERMRSLQERAVRSAEKYEAWRREQPVDAFGNPPADEPAIGAPDQLDP